jgi:hypothetical protein
MTNDPSKFCEAFDKWAELLMGSRDNPTGEGLKEASQFEEAWQYLRLKISKSCLLDRMIYGGEQPSQTPCPVHKGQWTGIHLPEQFTRPMDALSAQMCGCYPEGEGKSWRDLGCRCDQHKCGCTTGWNPDDHCGCGVKA